AAADVRLVRRPQGIVLEDASVVPARGGNLAERHAAAPDQLPVGQRGIRLWEPATESDDRNVQKTLPPAWPPGCLTAFAASRQGRGISRSRPAKCPLGHTVDAAAARELLLYIAPPMRVLLTGGSGFVGSYVAEQLSALGHTVRALVRPRSDSKLLKTLPNIEFAPGAGGERVSVAARPRGVDAGGRA